MPNISYIPLIPNILVSPASASTSEPIPAPVSTSASTSSPASMTDDENIINQNIKKIIIEKEKIENLIQQNNESQNSPLDITTSTARLDYTKLENKSLNIQVILLAILLIIIIIAIISIFMS